VQILRAYGLGQRKLDNPNAYLLRRTMHKMYFHFKPEFWYWKIGIMVRKFLIVVAGTLPTTVPSADLQRAASAVALFSLSVSTCYCCPRLHSVVPLRPPVPQERHLPDGHDSAGGHRVLRPQCPCTHPRVLGWEFCSRLGHGAPGPTDPTEPTDAGCHRKATVVHQLPIFPFFFSHPVPLRPLTSPQVSFHPYMSGSSLPGVVSRHEGLAAKGDLIHMVRASTHF